MDIYQYLLTQGQATVTELVSLVKLKQPTVSYHLKELKEAGLLVSKRQGKEMYYMVSGACPHRNESCVLSTVKFSG